MINLLVGFGIGFLIGLFSAGYIGYAIRIGINSVKKETEPEAGVNYGAYHPVKDSPGDESVIVEPKTPQRLQWEAEQALEKENLNLKPK